MFKSTVVNNFAKNHVLIMNNSAYFKLFKNIFILPKKMKK